MENLTDYLKDILEDKFTKDEEVKLEKSKDNKDIFKVNYNGSFKYIGSKYNVERDIDNFLFEVGNIGIDTLIIVFGLGTGEHILKLFDKLNSFNRVLVVEPDRRILKKFFKLQYSKSLLKDDKIDIVGFEKENIRSYIIEFICDENNYNNIRYAAYGNYSILYKIEYLYFLRSIKEVLLLFEGNLITKYVHGRSFMSCYLNNIKSIASSHYLNEFKDKFKDYTAVVVSAGPSLEKNIDELKNFNDNAIIICGNRTLKPLMEKGIIPDFMCSVDCSDAVYDMCKKYLNYGNIPLIFTETSNSKLVLNKRKGKIFFRYGSAKTSIQEVTGKNIDSLYSGGSVAHTCVDFARYIGCKVIIFIGQDLAYTNDMEHAQIAEMQSYNKTISNENLIQVDGLYGDKVLTTRVLNGYRDALEEYIKRMKNIKFINATEGGALIKGVETITLKEALDKYAVSQGIGKVVNDIFKKQPGIDRIKVIDNMKNILKGLMKINDEIKRCRENIISALLSNKISKMKYAYKKISVLNDELDNSSSFNFIDFLISDVMNRTSVYFRYQESKYEVENLKNILNAFKKLYNDIIETIDYVVPKIEKCIEDL
ncbi:motility associated factor glycosyltransferase family protein [Clostridium kluyveri]|uniref:WAC domain-containing protein n=2 Tax=Clostridium kluyveri TaxID=1534 RepID=A5MZ26_CLOK5|nr:6-hydroxymethylpterin diphosphokinase MptE-like protein [Clostridium kluyveri]EDK34122.1 Conserved hypothetical protein [Clostridium kluyveri DSM 555]BAH06900.1 hypothetical protein CKR_1849 [Clostridium kluyveri NBRC 12016]